MGFSDYIKKRRQGIYLGPTLGRATDRVSGRGCLCKDRDVYSVECCRGYLINQSIGSTEN